MMERCVMMDKKYPDAFKFLGHAYRQLTIYRKAIAAYKKHLSVNPYDVENDMIREFLEEMGVETTVVEELEEEERRSAEAARERARSAGQLMPGVAPSGQVAPSTNGAAQPVTGTPTTATSATPQSPPPSGSAPLQIPN
jgi:tetratricopeptide (TPR) repeat protein